jgi:hypothetical protein
MAIGTGFWALAITLARSCHPGDGSCWTELDPVEDAGMRSIKVAEILEPLSQQFLFPEAGAGLRIWHHTGRLG